jgi:hypothetical protein
MTSPLQPSDIMLDLFPFDPYREWLGIEPHEQPADHYRLIGVARFEQDREMIEAAADQRMAYLHSLETGPHAQDAAKLSREIAAAKQCLLNPDVRAAYDDVLRGLLAAQDTGHPLPPPPPPELPNAASSTTNSSAVPKDSRTPAGGRRETSVHARTWIGVATAVVVLLSFALIWGLGRSLIGPATNQHATETKVDPTRDDATPPAKDLSPQDSVAIINQQAGGDIYFPAALAQIEGSTAHLDTLGNDRVIGGWTSAEDRLSWEFRVRQLPPRGVFNVEVTYALTGPSTGRYGLEIGDTEITRAVNSQARPKQFTTDELTMAIRRPGRYRLTMRIKEKQSDELLLLKSIRLSPKA